MARLPQDKDALPLYGSVVGISISEQYYFGPGVSLRPGLFDTFSTPMMGFKEPAAGEHTPAPWVPVDGAYHSLQARAELVIESLSTFDGFSASQAAWLVATLLRLRIEAPVRISTLANVPLDSLKDGNDVWPLAFEQSNYQNGCFLGGRLPLTKADAHWLADSLPVAVRLYHDDRFMRALAVFDESIWSSRLEMSTILIWTAMEILFDCSGAQNKTKAISSALADCVGHDAADRDRTCNIVLDLYGKRGRVVHSGRDIEREDFAQSHTLARAAFMNVLGRKELPKPRSNTLQ